MIRRVPVQPTTNPEEAYALEGELTDLLPKDNTVYIDENGNTYDPHEGLQLQKLPESGVLQLPRTTWW